MTKPKDKHSLPTIVQLFASTRTNVELSGLKCTSILLLSLQ